MHVSTRALGAGAGDAGGAAGAIVEYLESGVAAKAGGRPGQTMGTEPAGADGYYADSSETPGQWVGRGVGNVHVTGPVEPEAFTRVLLGRDPVTGEQLVGAVGSAGRAELAGRTRGPAAEGEWLTVDEAADILNLGARYVRRLLERETGTSDPDHPLPKSYLLGNRDEQGRWRVARSEVERFAAARRKPTVVVGYDVTFSAPKSVSVLWAALEGPERAEVVASVDAAVAAGVAYLEDHAAFIRVQGRRVRSDGLIAASYLHGTSRALDPQLHRHVVIANMGSAGGRVQALDGTQIHLHQRTAAALAGAELRRQLSHRLGVQWSAPRRAKADILGVPTTVLRAMSTRSAEINELVAEMGTDTLAARQVAAYQTRAAKQAVAADGLRAGWQTRLAALGFDLTAAERCLGPTPDAGLSAEGHAELHAALGRLVTEDAACFDRRDVIAHVADWAGSRLTAAEVIDAADAWLATDGVVRIGTPPGWRTAKDGIRLGDGRRVHAATGAPRSTRRRRCSSWNSESAQP